MPTMSGSYSGRAQSQLVVTVPDVPGHVLDAFYFAATQSCTDAMVDGMTCALCGTSDLTGGQGRQSGYFTNTRPGGDQNHGTFEGVVGPDGDQTTVVGTWKFVGGAGRFAGITGNGTFKTVASATGDLSVTWDGAYTLP